LFLFAQSRMSGLRDSKRTDGMLLLVIEGPVEDSIRREMLSFLGNRIARGRLQGLAFSDGLTTLHYSFNGIHEKQLDGLDAGLRAIAPVRKLNLYFNNQGTLI